MREHLFFNKFLNRIVKKYIYSIQFTIKKIQKKKRYFEHKNKIVLQDTIKVNNILTCVKIYFKQNHNINYNINSINSF